jgi:hypothetical protein
MRLVSTTLLISLALPACGAQSPEEAAQAAQTALGAGRYAEAQATAEEALAAEGVAEDAALSWKLERVRVEALAGQGQGGAVLVELTRLSGTYVGQVTAEFHAKLGGMLNKAGDPLGALDVAEAGKQRFPDKATAFDGLIANLKAAAEAGDSAVAEKLRALGYL